jgi:Transcription factor WhiB
MRKPTSFHRDRLAELGPLLDTDPRWLQVCVERAENRACRGTGLDRFFPQDGARFHTNALLAERERVGELCRACPVRNECLAGALLRGETYGSWGGVAQPDFQTLSRLWRDEITVNAGVA